MFGAADVTTVRRSYAADAVLPRGRHPRPQRRILATDVRTPSLFGEPHRIIDKDEAVDSLPP